MKRRDTRILDAQKASRIRVVQGIPNRNEGNDGDFAISQFRNEIKLYVKFKGTWHGVSVGKAFDDIKNKVAKAITDDSKRNYRMQVATNKIFSDDDFTLDSSGDIELNADGGNVSIYDDTSKHFMFDCDNTRMRIFDDAAGNLDYLTIEVGANAESTITTTDAIGTAGHLTIQPDGDLTLDPASQKVIINATDGLYFDGGSDTYIYESGADNLRIVVGNDTFLDLIENGARGNYANFSGASAGFTQLEPTYNATDTDVQFLLTNKNFLTFGAGNITDIQLYFPPMSGNFTLLIKQDGTGSREISNWKVFDKDGNAASGSATVKFAGGSNPTLTTDANHVDIISFYWDADNEIAYGVATLDFQF